MASKNSSKAKSELGASMVEYALIVTFVVLMGFSSVSVVGTQVSATLDQANLDGTAGCTNGNHNQCMTTRVRVGQ